MDALEVRKGDVAVDLFVRRAAESCLYLSFHISGEVMVSCVADRSELSLQIAFQNSLV
ncbi:hypothetical protein [Prevotella sp. MGM1]|uniref:hypothetical protein n=1 Tax=Prevotella sp. MGM1 TaxID=2033405 RepID=UPI001304DC83|nr:hypothetical protein [Prevotella sp. MGM1]